MFFRFIFLIFVFLILHLFFQMPSIHKVFVLNLKKGSSTNMTTLLSACAIHTERQLL
ncbi:hypothetical protein HMPREF0971_01790 [Segatella oris F0302]|uniref:Uncharacterized protein n=1 Tax=Segatella oris F0302 TaxID=649760 RepID=D1QS35_9BACT|nr:hypothetical protein HMPREF0971_01790 [Segatella oris F0302]